MNTEQVEAMAREVANKTHHINNDTPNHLCRAIEESVYWRSTYKDCLEMASRLVPKGYAVVPEEPTEAELEEVFDEASYAGRIEIDYPSQLAELRLALIIAHNKSLGLSENKALIANTGEGK